MTFPRCGPPIQESCGGEAQHVPVCTGLSPLCSQIRQRLEAAGHPQIGRGLPESGAQRHRTGERGLHGDNLKRPRPLRSLEWNLVLRRTPGKVAEPKASSGQEHRDVPPSFR